jgi:threonyl-tRNA synthetase
VDDRTESLNRKVRDAQLKSIPLIVTIGNREKEAGTLSVRTLDGTVHHGIAQGDFVEKVTAQVAGRKLDGDVFA